jgi:cell division protein FtsZ
MMSISLKAPDVTELKPRISVFGVGGAGGNAVSNMIRANLEGVEFVIANTDAQAMANSPVERKIQMGTSITEGLGAGSRPEVGCAAAEESLPEIIDQLTGSHMVFITAGMGGGTGTGAAPVIARAARDQGILTVGVVTKPFHFEGARRMRVAEAGILELQRYVDTLIVIPNQNLFRLANEKTTFADAFKLADEVLHSGVRGITDLMVMPGLINLDFADVRTVMNEMGKAMMGTGEAEGEGRAIESAEAAINNPLLDEVPMKGARGVLINITGGMDMTLFEVDEAANRVRGEVDPDANIIVGSTFNEGMEGKIRVSIVATGIEDVNAVEAPPEEMTTTKAVGGTPSQNGMMRPAARQPYRQAPAAAAAKESSAWRPKSPVVSAGGVTAEDSPSDLDPATDIDATEEKRPPAFGSLREAADALAEKSDSVQSEEHFEGEVKRVASGGGGAGFPIEPRSTEARMAPQSQPKRGGLLNRVASVSLGRVMEGMGGKPEAPTHRQEPGRPGAMPPRVQQSEGKSPSSDDEEMFTDDKEQLEIPAFLRRQSN